MAGALAASLQWSCQFTVRPEQRSSLTGGGGAAGKFLPGPAAFCRSTSKREERALLRTAGARASRFFFMAKAVGTAIASQAFEHVEQPRCRQFPDT
jgi:hypothetical protein